MNPARERAIREAWAAYPGPFPRRKPEPRDIFIPANYRITDHEEGSRYAVREGAGVIDTFRFTYEEGMRANGRAAWRIICEGVVVAWGDIEAKENA